MKRIRLTLTIAIICIPIGVYAIGYHGPRDFTGSEKLPPLQNVINSARALSGTPYDPLMGMYGNIGASVGFIVCSDIPNIAYGLNGFSWKNELEKDFKVNSKFYNTENGNTPGNPFFHRRARNLYSYFVANGKLNFTNSPPKVGDMVFYRKIAKGHIAHVALITEVTEDGFRIMESAPRTLFAKEVDQSSPVDRGWIYAGIGIVYN